MSKRLAVGLVIAAGLSACAAFFLQVPAAAQTSKVAEDHTDSIPHPATALPMGMAWVEESVIEKNGVVRTTMAARSMKELQERYLAYHSRLAGKLTAEQLAEKCNQLRRTPEGLSAEDEIELLKKHLGELERKHLGNKEISSRIRGAIEALNKKTELTKP